jgi:hypothetical protein
MIGHLIRRVAVGPCGVRPPIVNKAPLFTIGGLTPHDLAEADPAEVRRTRWLLLAGFLILSVDMAKGFEFADWWIVSRHLWRLFLLVFVAAGVFGPAEARARDARKSDGARADSYHVLFDDGSEVTGKSIDGWDNPESISVAGRKLLDPRRLARFVRDTNRDPASPAVRVVMVNGDVLPGNLTLVELAEDTPGKPICMRVAPSAPVRNARSQWAGIPVRPRYVRRVVRAGESTRHAAVGGVLLRDNSQISCQAMKWTAAGLGVLTAKGARTFKINDLLDVRMPRADTIAPILDDSLAPCPKPDSLIVRVTTTSGARLTCRGAMLAVHKKGLLTIQPVWALNAISVPLSEICALSVRRYDEVPLSLLPGETLAEKAYTGFVWKWRRDRSVRGRPLVSGALSSDLGLGTHAYSAVAFDLPRDAANFSFIAGLDKRVGAGGCVKLHVRRDKIDGKPLWASDFMRGGGKPISVKSLNCRDAKRLVLTTDFAHKGRPSGADPFDIRDEVNWLMPTVRLDAGAMVRRYRDALQHFSGLSGWAPENPAARKVHVPARWDNTDEKWEPALPIGASGLTLRREVHVGYHQAQLWISGVAREGTHEISLWIAGKPVKCADGKASLKTAGDPRSAQWSLAEHMGKDVTLALKIRPTDPRRSSPLTRPQIWFACEPVIIPIAKGKPVKPKWRYTTEKPGDGWRELKFDDSSWSVGTGYFRGSSEPDVGTKWSTSDIWIRKYFQMPQTPVRSLVLTSYNDDIATAYINGTLAASFPTSYRSYRSAKISPQAGAALKPGKNVIAVHGNDIGGQRYLDVGLSDATGASPRDPRVVIRPIRPMPGPVKGMVRLLGKHARIAGQKKARFDSEINALAHWWRSSTWFEWNARVPASGKYVVQLTYGCISRSAGSKYTIKIGEHWIRGVVSATGRWATFTTDDAATIDLKKGGSILVSVYISYLSKKGTMTLHAVTLVPVE